MWHLTWHFLDFAVSCRSYPLLLFPNIGFRLLEIHFFPSSFFLVRAVCSNFSTNESAMRCFFCVCRTPFHILDCILKVGLRVHIHNFCGWLFSIVLSWLSETIFCVLINNKLLFNVNVSCCVILASTEGKRFVLSPSIHFDIASNNLPTLFSIFCSPHSFCTEHISSHWNELTCYL